MKRFFLGIVVVSSAVLAGCGSPGGSIIVFDGIDMQISQWLVAVSSSTVDQTQIVHKVLQAFKNGPRSLIVARSALTADLSPTEYANALIKSLTEQFAGYQLIGTSALSFPCGKETVDGTIHNFSIADNTNVNPGKTFVSQYYFIARGTPYVISQADRTSSEQSDFTSIVSSLHCQ